MTNLDNTTAKQKAAQLIVDTLKKSYGSVDEILDEKMGENYDKITEGKPQEEKIRLAKEHVVKWNFTTDPDELVATLVKLWVSTHSVEDTLVNPGSAACFVRHHIQQGSRPMEARKAALDDAKLSIFSAYDMRNRDDVYRGQTWPEVTSIVHDLAQAEWGLRKNDDRDLSDYVAAEYGNAETRKMFGK